MPIIADKRIPEPAAEKLQQYGEVVLFSSEGITYPAIAGHPDIFFTQTEGELIIPPNLPVKFKDVLVKNEILFIEGELPVGLKYPETARHNAVYTENYLIHNFRHTDASISDRAGERELIHVDQGYTRCNLLPLKNNHFITSDAGISRALNRYELNHLCVDPAEIILPGMKHGFFGGACGIYEENVFILGRLNKFADGERVRNYLEDLHYKIIELYDGHLFDGGSIIFI
jgi:hypothetical protein